MPSEKNGYTIGFSLTCGMNNTTILFVKEQNTRVLIVTSKNEHVEACGNAIEKELRKASFQVSRKNAAETTIPMVNAADILIFGIHGTQLPPEFSEINRAFTGINLAGRTGALFVDASESAAGSLKEMLKDTDINLSSQVFYCRRESSTVNSSALTKWVQTILKTYRDMIHERQF